MKHRLLLIALLVSVLFCSCSSADLGIVIMPKLNPDKVVTRVELSDGLLQFDEMSFMADDYYSYAWYDDNQEMFVKVKDLIGFNISMLDIPDNLELIHSSYGFSYEVFQHLGEDNVIPMDAYMLKYHFSTPQEINYLKTEDKMYGQSAEIYVKSCSEDEEMRFYGLLEDNSMIGGNPLALGFNTEYPSLVQYNAQFEYKGTGYHIRATNIPQEELIELLISILTLEDDI